MRRPVLPRASSATSGFFFCVMIDEPVAKESSSSTQPNDGVVQIMISSPSRDRCTPVSAATKRNSAAKSRSETASIEFCAAAENPSSRATSAGSSGNEEPASAPDPSGQMAARRSQSRSRSRSRSNAWTCASSWWPNTIGWAGCRWVKPGAGVPTWRAACSTSASTSSTRRAATPRTRSRRYSRRSVATWSLRDRPARSLPPSAPTRSSRPRSRAVCTSSSSTLGRNSPDARDAARSYGASRQSNCTLMLSRASASAGVPANRPPHSRVGVLGPSGRPGDPLVRLVCSLTALPYAGVPGRGETAGQAPQLDETLGQGLVERVTGVVGGQPEVVQARRRPPPGHHGAAAVQGQPYLTGDMPLGVPDERVQGAPQRRVPQPVVDQLAPALVDQALEPGHVPLDRHVLQL